ncbi:MAG: hypothetical protein ABSH00_13185 [Bryobacteraceae bacterium]
MQMPWVGIRRLALVLGIAGAAYGAFGCFATFNDVSKQRGEFDAVQNYIRGGFIVSHADNTLWWKDKARQEHPYAGPIPNKRPDEGDALWSVVLPVAGFFVPWGGVLIVAWIIAGFLGSNQGRSTSQ